MNSDLDQLRKILLGPEFDDLLRLKAEYEDDEKFTEHISRIVTEALKARSKEDDSIGDVLAPAIDNAISTSINQDPKKLAESLYPIMGPAIRKSISETMQQMLDNFNNLLEQSLSPQSMRWRFDAWRTGRSYSELVLLNTMEYQVDQVFVIHRETSLLISHVESDLSVAKDPDMVSSMLSAIQDFVEDSFATTEGDQLDTLRLGDLSVVVSRGPQAVMAAVVRGQAPEHLRGRMHETLEDLHRHKRGQLIDYSGDPDEFEDTSSDLRSLLEMKRREEEDQEKKIPWLAIAAIIVLIAISSYFGYRDYEQRQYLDSQLTLIESEPGLVLLSFEGNGPVITLLKDPLARSPEEFVTANPEQGFQPKFTAYSHLSADDTIVSQRVQQKLKPATETNLSVSDGTLKFAGRATTQWFSGVREAALGIAGVRSLDTSALDLYNPVLDAMNARINRVQSLAFEFESAAADVDPTDPAIKTLADDILEIQQLWRESGGREINVDILGYTDATGTARANRRLGLSRAEALKSALADQGIPESIMTAYYGPDLNEQLTSNKRTTKLIIRTL